MLDYVENSAVELQTTEITHVVIEQPVEIVNTEKEFAPEERRTSQFEVYDEPDPKTELKNMICRSIINIPCTLIILFVLQTAIGMGSSWILLYTSGQTAVNEVNMVKHQEIFINIFDKSTSTLNNAIGILDEVNVTLGITNGIQLASSVKDLTQHFRILKDPYPQFALFYVNIYGEFSWIMRDGTAAYIDKNTFNATLPYGILNIATFDSGLNYIPFSESPSPLNASTLWWYQLMKTNQVCL
jgi:hypothetical protein